MNDIIYIINIEQKDKPGRIDGYKYSIESWNRWAEHNNAQVVVLDQYINPDARANWHKFYIFDLLEDSGIEYDQILIVDADTFVHPECPNFFKISDRKYCGVHNRGSYDWLIRSIEAYDKFVFKTKFEDINKYINTGFQIVNKDHRPFFSAVLEFYESNKKLLTWVQDNYKVGTDQTPINFLLQIYNVDLKILPYEYNMQDMARNESLSLLNDGTPLFTKFGWIYHFNAIPNNVNGNLTKQWLKECYTYFYGKEIIHEIF